MAKILDVPHSGSIHHKTHSHNRAGQYIRNRRSPVQPVGTGRRAFVKAAFGAASTGWSALSDADRAAWIAWANGHPIVDSLGQSITKTGHQAYVGVATSLQNVGLALPTVPPVSTDTASPVVAAFTVTAAGVITITLTPSGTADDFILISFTQPVSPGVTFNKTFWQQTFVAGDSVGGATFGAAYVAQFGTIPVGGKIFLQLTPVNQYGFTGVPVTMTAIAT